MAALAAVIFGGFIFWMPNVVMHWLGMGAFARSVVLIFLVIPLAAVQPFIGRDEWREGQFGNYYHLYGSGDWLTDQDS